METIQTYGQWQLNKYSKLKYFKNGRANMHVEITYCIEYDNAGAWERAGKPENFEHVETGMFWIKTKKEALKEWQTFKKTHSLSGAQLRADLFGGAE